MRRSGMIAVAFVVLGSGLAAVTVAAAGDDPEPKRKRPTAAKLDRHEAQLTALQTRVQQLERELAELGGQPKLAAGSADPALESRVQQVERKLGARSPVETVVQLQVRHPASAQLVITVPPDLDLWVDNPRAASGEVFYITDVLCVTATFGIEISVPELAPTPVLVSALLGRPISLTTAIPFASSLRLRMEAGGEDLWPEPPPAATLVLSGYWSTRQPNITAVAVKRTAPPEGRQ